MRGEDDSGRVYLSCFNGSPPHARGRRDREAGDVDVRGITPACAGKTGLILHTEIGGKDHPRMRGEDRPSRAKEIKLIGSPPHARGRLKTTDAKEASGRITPACAGKTSRTVRMGRRRRDHPRMRGEDVSRKTQVPPHQGSPPHARGRQVTQRPANVSWGITPACAGKTPHRSRSAAVGADHPRMRGEDTSSLKSSYTMEGSPPHARGRRCADLLVGGYQGITPACAGKTCSLCAGLPT